MSEYSRIRVIDAGNTSIKLGVFEDHELVQFEQLSLEDCLTLTQDGATSTVLASVRSEFETKQLIDHFGAQLLDTSCDLPFDVHYDNSTLGMDRLCNAMYLYNHMPSKQAVSVDIGTCIKFDFMDRKQGFRGGSISPGLDLRYKSLNDYTGKLPLLSNKSAEQLVGNDTESSIRSGVVNGMQGEINGFVQHYASGFDGLTFFVTGGDAQYFDIHSKNDIFAVENLTLRGLYEIYLHNS